MEVVNGYIMGALGEARKYLRADNYDLALLSLKLVQGYAAEQGIEERDIGSLVELLMITRSAIAKDHMKKAAKAEQGLTSDDPKVHRLLAGLHASYLNGSIANSN